ncbi:hypothetical protein [Teredinibacter franksiae]|uniref:hypothetical protein n=1 Tax=Teredinibacter franksiae TaxID=2761453 RepID=UPI001624BF01|nr:hypothetical protein [Teredinibacter franksiae]
MASRAICIEKNRRERNHSPLLRGVSQWGVWGCLAVLAAFACVPTLQAEEYGIRADIGPRKYSEAT